MAAAFEHDGFTGLQVPTVEGFCVSTQPIATISRSRPPMKVAS
jgi:hypothetical protein